MFSKQFSAICLSLILWPQERCRKRSVKLWTNRRIRCELLEICMKRDGSVGVRMPHNFILYKSDEPPKTSTTISHNSSDDCTMKIAHQSGYRKHTLNDSIGRCLRRDLMSLLNPNWYFSQLILEFEDSNVSARRIELLRTLLADHQTMVQHFKVHSRTLEPVRLLLPYIDPSTIEQIGLHSEVSTTALELIMKSAQWTRVKRVTLGKVDEAFPMKTLYGLEVFKISEIDISMSRLMKLRDAIIRPGKLQKGVMSFKSILCRKDADSDTETDEDEASELQDLRSKVIRVMAVDFDRFDTSTMIYRSSDSTHYKIKVAQNRDVVSLKVTRYNS